MKWATQGSEVALGSILCLHIFKSSPVQGLLLLDHRNPPLQLVSEYHIVQETTISEDGQDNKGVSHGFSHKCVINSFVSNKELRKSYLPMLTSSKYVFYVKADISISRQL